MTDKIEAWRAITRLRYERPEPALREIAELIRSGCDDPMFLRVLADHIDPDVKTTPLGTKLVLHRTTGPKSPPKEPNYELRAFLERFIDIFPDGEPAEPVKSEASKRYGVSRSTCGEELRIMRKWQARDPAAFQQRCDAARLLREAGDPDYQRLWPEK